MTVTAPPLYFPALKWHSPEQGAIHSLTAAQKSGILPIVDLGDRPYNGTTLTYMGTWEEHFQSFAISLKHRWGTTQEIAVDQGLVNFDALAGENLWHQLFQALYRCDVRAVPVVSSGASTEEIESLRGVVAPKKGRLMLRAAIGEFASNHTLLTSWIQTTMAALNGAPENVDLVLDCRSVEAPAPSAAQALADLVAISQELDNWRRIVLLSGAFPASLSSLPEGMHRLARADWLLFCKVLADWRAPTRLCFGDYGPTHCDSFDYDPRATREPIKLIMSEEAHWCVIKGRRPKGHGYDQYRALCATAAELSRGQPVSSFGLQNMIQRATHLPRTIGVGVPAQWQRDSINQHLVTVIQQLEREIAARQHAPRSRGLTSHSVVAKEVGRQRLSGNAARKTSPRGPVEANDV